MQGPGFKLQYFESCSSETFLRWDLAKSLEIRSVLFFFSSSFWAGVLGCMKNMDVQVWCGVARCESVKAEGQKAHP